MLARNVILLISIYLFFSFQLQAQPSWNINPSDFEFDMTVIGVPLNRCIELKNDSNRIAAFIDNELRGVEYTSVLSHDRHYAYLFVYSNEQSPKSIRFKLYDQLKDSVYDILDTLIFKENSVIGTDENPFYFNTKTENLQLTISTKLISEKTLIGEEVAEAWSINSIQDTVRDYYSFIDDQDGKDNAYFEWDASHLLLKQKVDSSHKGDFHIHFRTTNNKSCFAEKSAILPFLLSHSEEPKGESSIQIYPNPTADKIQIISPHRIQKIEIVNNQGKCLAIKLIDNEIDLTTLVPGLYFLKIFSDRNLFCRKIILRP